MPSMLLAIGARCAILVVFAFILSKTLPKMPNKVWRFVFLFALLVPFILVIDGVDVRLRGLHKMSWIEISIGALLFAALGALWLPRLDNSTTP